MPRYTLAFGLLATLALPAYAQDGVPAGKPTMLLHGNYCGPGNNAPAAPVDALDAACARHDACTPDEGLPTKSCNVRLQAEAGRIADDPRQPADLRMVAGLVASGAAMMPSAPAARTGSTAARVALAPRHPVAAVKVIGEE